MTPDYCRQHVLELLYFRFYICGYGDFLLLFLQVFFFFFNCLQPGGSMFLTTINKTVCAWIGAIAVAEYMLHLLPPGTHDYNKFVPRQDLLFMLEKSEYRYHFITCIQLFK